MQRNEPQTNNYIFISWNPTSWVFGFFFVPFRFHSISLQTKWNKKPNYKKKTHYSLHILLEGM